MRQEPPAKHDPVDPRAHVHESVRTRRDWGWFVLQAILVAALQVGNDVIRGNIWPPSTTLAQRNAQDVVAFERSYRLFLEPGLQIFFQHGTRILNIPVSWHLIMSISNSIYGICHIVVTLSVAVWVFVRHRSRLAIFRDVMLLTGLLALVGYETFPLAPPRLTPGLSWHGRAFAFQDTMGHVLGTGHLNGIPIGYNPLSAMPSLHVAWAIIVGATLVLLARNLLLRLLGLVYPVLMSLATIVTANHYIMDAAGAGGAVILATVLAMVIRWGCSKLGSGAANVSEPRSHQRATANCSSSYIRR